MAVAALTSSRKGWRITKTVNDLSRRHSHPLAADAGAPRTPWITFRHALREGWQATRPTYNPDTRLWSAWAIPPSSVRVLPVRGFGPTAAASVLDLATRLGDRFGTGG